MKKDPISLRIRLKKTQSLLPQEELTTDFKKLKRLEIWGESLEKIPDLSHLTQCQFLEIFSPKLQELGNLPPNLLLFKLKEAMTLPPSPLPQKIETLQLSGIRKKNFLSLLSKIGLPSGVINLNLSHNGITELPHLFHNLPKLKRLTLDNNLLQNLPEEIYTLPEINHLSLDGNPLDKGEREKLFKHFGLWF